jgi:hypothetical protein
LGTLLVCGVVDVVVAALWETWWLLTVGGMCLAAAAAVAVKWQGHHATRCGAPLPVVEPPERQRRGVDALETAA